MSIPNLPDKIRLIWDFKGPEAAQTAKHHKIHLKEFIQHNQTKFNETGLEKVGDLHTLVFMAIDKEEMDDLRERLRPHRAQEW